MALPELHPETPQTLCFDADDTLWENNIYFEQAIAAFVSLLDHHAHTPDEVRARLDACERVTIARYGYGLKSFERSLLACFEQMTAVPVRAEIAAKLRAFAETIATQEIELLPEVEATLRSLAGRHRLLLVTKGDPLEQRAKLQRSGLGDLFTAVEVPPEKTAAMYRELAGRHGCESGRTWMIGNSPRSDVNPALAAGWNVVYLPHPSTWALEKEALEAAPEGQCLAILERFGELLGMF